jgi:hypothetical protein
MAVVVILGLRIFEPHASSMRYSAAVGISASANR